MAVFPVFIELKDKKCVVVGGGTVAERKIEALIEFGAKIVVISMAVNGKIRDLERNGRIEVMEREYSSGDLDGAFLAIAATDNPKTNEEVYKDALKKGIFINVVDCPKRCNFIFPAIVKRGDMVIGISTSGAYPALSKRIREKLETLFPNGFEVYLEILKDLRSKAGKRINDKDKRTEFLTKVLDDVLDKDISKAEEFKEKAKGIFKEYVDEKDY